jgi:hypothetical protein
MRNIRIWIRDPEWKSVRIRDKTTRPQHCFYICRYYYFLSTGTGLKFFFLSGTSALSGIREEVKQIAVGPSHFALLLEDGRLARLPFSVISDRLAKYR